MPEIPRHRPTWFRVLKYLCASAACLVFALLYEMYVNDGPSPWLTGMFLVPLLLAGAVLMLKRPSRKGR